nr:MAG TPA: hypothetical protein [Caudoviricetes sp.]
MPKLYRNAHDFAIVIGSFYVRPGDTIELVGYNGSMLEPVAAEEPAAEPTPAEAEPPVTEEKPKRARKSAAESEAE